MISFTRLGLWFTEVITQFAERRFGAGALIKRDLKKGM